MCSCELRAEIVLFRMMDVDTLIFFSPIEVVDVTRGKSCDIHVISCYARDVVTCYVSEDQNNGNGNGNDVDDPLASKSIALNGTWEMAMCLVLGANAPSKTSALLSQSKYTTKPCSVDFQSVNCVPLPRSALQNVQNTLQMPSVCDVLCCAVL